MRIKIKVTKKIIKQSIALLQNPLLSSDRYCPIVLAIQKSIRNDDDIRIFVPHCLWEVYRNNLPWARLPIKALAFIHNFDSGAEVEPFTFTLDVPKEIIKK